MAKQLQLTVGISVLLFAVTFASCKEITFNHTTKEITFANLHHPGAAELKFNLTNGWARFMGGSQTGNHSWFLDFTDYDNFVINRVHSNESASWYNLTMTGLLRRTERHFCFDLQFSGATWYHLKTPGNSASKTLVDLNETGPKRWDFTTAESLFVNSNGFAIGALKRDAFSEWAVSHERLQQGRPNLCWSIEDRDPNSFPGHNAIFNFFIIAGRSLDEVAKFTGNLTLFK